MILIGAPGSGKTTFAKYFIRTEENWYRLSRDDFREMNFQDGALDAHTERLVSEMFDAAIEALLRRKCNILLDATHCRADYLNHFINKYNTQADITFRIFEAPVEELIARCDRRYAETGRFVPAGAIKHFVSELETLKKSFDFAPRYRTKAENETAKQDATLPRAIICDLDGTLAIIGDRDVYDASKADEDALNQPVANILNAFAEKGYAILLVSGRDETFRAPTERFLDKYKIPYNQLYMRTAKDMRKDAVVKREIFDNEIAGKFFIDFILDDRNQMVDMWRRQLRLPCFQVNYGDF
jgi:predicted kinase